MTDYVCHSGGCPGADLAWEAVGDKYGVTTQSYSFYNHVQYGRNPVILSLEELNEGFQNVQIAAKSIGRKLDGLYPYAKHLLCRNWFQVKNSEAIYAIGTFLNDTRTIVSGGTGWAVQMGIDNQRPIYFYDQDTKAWYQYSYDDKRFNSYHAIPILYKNFAGIGTRKTTDDGLAAIVEVYQNTFDKR